MRHAGAGALAPLAMALSMAFNAQVCVGQAEPARLPTVTDIFNLDFTGKICAEGPVRVAHVESFNPELYNGPGEAMRSMHAPLAAQILWNRYNQDRDECRKVRWLDLDLRDPNFATASILQEYDVLTSSVVFPRTGVRAPQILFAVEGLQPVPMPTIRDPYLQPMNMESVVPGYWAKTKSIIVHSAGNEGPDTRQLAFPGFEWSPLLINVGAMDASGDVSIYSSWNAPDIVWTPPTMAGFCYPYRATDAQIKDRAGFYGVHATDAAPGAGKNVCGLPGTSFSAPDIGGFVARAVAAHPGIDPILVTSAVYLAATRNIGSVEGAFNANAAGLPFNAFNAGHGAFVPGAFEAIMKRAAGRNGTRTDQRAAHVIRLATKASARGGLTFFSDEELSAVAVKGSLVFDAAGRGSGSRSIDYFPLRLRVTSPSGTQYEVPLRLDANDNPWSGRVKAAFTLTGWLGERAGGLWTVDPPEDSRFILREGGLIITGVQGEAARLLSGMIDAAQSYFAEDAGHGLPPAWPIAWENGVEGSAPDPSIRISYPSWVAGRYGAGSSMQPARP